MLQTLEDAATTTVEQAPQLALGWEDFGTPLFGTPLYVRDLMTTAPVSISPDLSVSAARALMQERRIRHLPVLEQHRLVGMVSDRDLRLVMPSPATSLAAGEIHYLLDQLTVQEIMTRFVITASPTLPVRTAISRMLRHRIGALPVTEDKQVIGILTRSDVLRAFLRLHE